jgi:membrane peptidoglycan carboxypeptidase
MVTGSTGFDRGAVRLDEVFDTNHGLIRIGRITIKEDKHHDYGRLTLAGILEHSSNIGIIQVGLRLGAQRLYEGASAFGVGKATGVDLPGEGVGIFRPLSRWSALSNASISMGQEVAVTALQLARVAAVIANGGRLVAPHIVTQIRYPDGRVEKPEFPEPARVISEETAASVRAMLQGVVEKGTGTTAAIPGFTVAGKTGTAQKAGPGGYQPGRYVPNFVGFVPADNPKLVAVVVVEEPHGKYYARDVAAPLFSRIVSQALDILRIAPTEQRLPSTVLARSDGKVHYPSGIVPVSVKEQGVAVEEAPLAMPAIAASSSGASSEVAVPASDVTPDVLGLSARQALAVFAKLGLTARLSGTGFVISQDPPPGAPLRPGEPYTLRLSETAPPINRPGRGREESSPSSGP